jgi:hypothetical protein
MWKYAVVAVGLALSLVLGATLFREPIAWAAQEINVTIVGPLDKDGNVKVRHQGSLTANVQNLVAVHETGISRVEVVNDEPLASEPTAAVSGHG